MGTDFLNYGMFAILAVLIFFMFRNSRKRKQIAEELKEQMVPGVEIMTNFGLFGTLVSIDKVSNVAEVETSPGNIVRVHSQTIARVVPEVTDNGEPRSVEEAMERANREAELREQEERDTAAPEFGERVDPTTKAVRKSSKKTTD